MIRICDSPKRFATAVKRPLSARLRRWRSTGGAHMVIHGGGERSLASHRKSKSNIPVLTSAVDVELRGPSPVLHHKLLSSGFPVPSSAAVEVKNLHLRSAIDHPEMSGDALFGARPDSWWTGCKPQDAPGMRPNGRLSSLPLLKLSGCSKKDMLDYFDNTWILTESLFSSLQGEEAFMSPPAHGLRHPFIFYYGHPAALYINKLRAAGLIKEPVNQYLEALLATGVDEMSWDDLSKNQMDWPSVAEVHAYRRAVYDTVRSVIENAPVEEISNITSKSPYWALPMGFEHERIHVDTSSVLIREKSLAFLAKPETWPECHPSSPGGRVVSPVAGVDYPFNPLVAVEGDSVTLGKPKDFPSFGWDNEYGSRTYSVPAFEASQNMISNGELMEFVKDSGYARSELWTEKGWAWKMFRNAKHPQFWVPEGPSGLHEYSLRVLFEEIDMPWDWPVIVNYHEASAFARWKTLNETSEAGAGGKAYRLETELEHHLIRDTSYSGGFDPIMSTIGPMSEDGGANLNLSWGSESPVDAMPSNGKGFKDVFGNIWEWCEDHFSALNNFKINVIYEDFSTPCFDGEHNVIMGGCFASTGNEASVFARYSFRPHFHQNAGFRLVAPVDPSQATQFVTSCTDAPAPYVGSYPFRRSAVGRSGTASHDCLTREKQEAERLLTNVSMHFALPPVIDQDEIIATGVPYPQRCGRLVVNMLENEGNKFNSRVLDAGCGAGGAAFEMSKEVGEVVAVDGVKSLIETASMMARDGRLNIKLPLDGENEVLQESVLDPAVDRSRVKFLHCDPMCLPASWTDFDAVLMHSLIDAVPSPKGLLERMGGARGMVRQGGGLLIIVSSYDWNENTTPKEGWLGEHYNDSGEKVSSLMGISRGLGRDFQLIHQEIMPCLVPLTKRKFIYTSAQATVWRRA